MSLSNQTDTPSFWTPTRAGMAIAAVVLIAAIASALINTGDESVSDSISEVRGLPSISRPMPTPAGPMIARSAPAPAPAPVARPISETVRKTSFQMIDGKSKKLSDYHGKVLVLDIWATWCGPCRLEIPHLVAMANEYKSKGVEIIGLTTENPQTDEELVREFSKQFEINYQIGWINQPLAVELMNGKGSIPQTLIIGRDGTVRKHFIGFHPVISVPQMKAALEDAIAAG